ncbi:MAG: sensor histidine kinase [Cyclobacteriaceae bacterium]|nr:sensor histidine kinase [Cyclobacteriaceae bacterium]
MESTVSEGIASYWVLILGTSGMLLLTVAIILFVYLYQRKLIRRKLAYQKIQDMLQKQELNSAYAILQAQDKERKRIAQDLHDNMGSILVTLNMYADTLEAVKKDKDVKQLARQISKLAQQANTANRNVAHSLDSGTLRHFGLKTALTDLAEAIKQANGMQIALEMDFTKIENVKTGVNLYRIVQELFNNTLKHAEATRIGLELTEAKGRLCLIYEDNGIGFDTAEVKENSMGLANLKARAESIGGEITIDSALGKGTTAILEVENG